MGWWIAFTPNVSILRSIVFPFVWRNFLYSNNTGIPCVTDCVLAELEKLGHRYRIALRVARDPRFERLACSHQGTYADDCLVQRVTASRCYIVATCDRELRRRIRKIPGVPLMYIVRRRYAIERLPDQGAPSWATVDWFKCTFSVHCEHFRLSFS